MWLDRYYQSPATEASRIQTCVIGHYLDVTQRILESPASTAASTVHIVERGPDAVRDIFLPMNEDRCPEMKYFYPLIESVFFRDECDANDNAALPQLPWRFAKNIYLRVPPEVCLRRVRRRARGNETRGAAAITLKFLETLHELHDAVYLDRPDVFVIDVPSGSGASNFTPDAIARRIWNGMNTRSVILH